MERYDNSPAEIVNATSADIPEIMALQNECLFPNKQGASDAEKAKGGFLIYPISEDEISDVISEQDQHILLVSKEEGHVNGYLLAYDLDTWKQTKPTWEESIEVSDETKLLFGHSKCLYLRHIARKNEHEGVGSELFGKIEDEARKLGYEYLVAEIQLEPIPNNTSLKFGKKVGLELKGKVHDGAREWGLFIKPII